MLEEHYKRLKDDWRNGDCLDKFMFFVELPFNYLRRFTIPISCDVEYNKFVAMMHPILTPVFCMWQYYRSQGQGELYFLDVELFPDFKLIYIFLGLGFVLSILIFFSSHRTKMPEYDIIFAIFGFFMSIWWIKITADYVMNILNLIPLVSGLRTDFLGLTLLAWGNSLGDYFANSALAKKGYGVTAVTGCFAG